MDKKIYYQTHCVKCNMEIPGSAVKDWSEGGCGHSGCDYISKALTYDEYLDELKLYKNGYKTTDRGT